VAETKERLNLIQKITKLFSKSETEYSSELGGDIITTERENLQWDSWDLFNIKNERQAKYKDYDKMDEDFVELSSAMDVYADFVTSSGNEGDIFSVDVGDNDEELPQKMADVINELEDRLDLKTKSWFITRNIVKFGDAFYENVANSSNVVKLKYLPESDTYIKFLPSGQRDPKLPYFQRDKNAGRVIAEFEPWEITHFKVGDEDYGVNNALLRRLRRTYRVEKLLEDTIVVTRVGRANRRAVYRVDVTGMSTIEALKYVRRLKIMNRRRRFFDENGNLRTEDDPLTQQEDIYIPVRKGGETNDFTMIEGERHLGEIRDIQHFHNKLFSATKVPKAYLGYEGDVNAKATLTEQSIAFHKTIRRFRSALATGLKKIYKVEFLLNGIDPNKINWEVTFPPLGNADEEVKWRVESLKTNVLGAYSNLFGVKLPSEWIIRKMMMGLTPVEQDELIDLLKKEENKAKKAAKEQQDAQQPEQDPMAALLQQMAGAKGKDKAAKGKENPADVGKASAPGDDEEEPSEALQATSKELREATDSELDDLQKLLLASPHLFVGVRKAEADIKRTLRGNRRERY
jgi:hypothetical protein